MKKANKNHVDQRAIESYVVEALDTDQELIISEENLRDLTSLLDELNFTNLNNELERDGKLFFGSRIPNEYSGAMIRLSKGGLRREVKGCLYNQATDVFNLLDGEFNTTVLVSKGARRTEKSVYPKDALREVIMNAICHKDYEQQVPIQIKIDEFSIRVSNPGTLPLGWTIEKLRNKHESFPRNQKILRAFTICFYVEHEGGGIEKIVSDCKENRIFPPVFEVDESGVTVAIYFNPVEWLSQKGFKKENYHKIVEYILVNNQITNQEVQEITKFGETQSTKYLNDLKGVIEKHGTKGSSVFYTLAKDFYEFNGL